MSGVRCQVLGVRCQVLGVKCFDLVLKLRFGNKNGLAFLICWH
ncbi:Uncharacterized protein dnm_087290 [Desulfonema magnum]|uniref:Uncharacterized protein n=1 Tax=Desulfonema magnum TaxID=45655 RepID=A0A975BW85_9BACT|nr:Uncharacterized protein dnm_087290 [Desulfonema magnum]